MDQNTVLADALLKMPSLIGGLLSQMNSNLASGFSQSGMFSSLLSQNTNLQASLTPSALAPSALQNNSSSSSSTSTASGSASSDVLQNLDSLSATLRQVLHTLRQQSQSNDSSSASSASSSSTSAASNAQNGDAAQTSNATTKSTDNGAGNNQGATGNDSGNANAQNDTSSSSSTTTTKSASATATGGNATDSSATASADATTAAESDVKLLTDIVSELLMLTQMMIKNLQQPQKIATGDAATGVKASGISALESAALANAAGAATSGTASGSASGSSDTTNSNDASATDPLLQLLTVLQQTAQQLMPKTTTTTATTAPASLPSIAAHLAALDTGLKNMFPVLQKSQNLATASASAEVSDSSVSGTASRSQSASDSSTKATKSDDWKSQLFGMLGGSSQTAAPQMTQPTPQQAFAAAIAGSADKNASATSSGSDGGSDLLSDKNSAATLSAPLTSNGLTAEGANAAGTYTFASQLSAFRTANGGNAGLPTAVDQVILQMNRSVKNGQDQMSLQLQPGDMGKITVKLDFSADGKVQGMVTAENPKTLDMLQKDSRSLERALQDAGLSADPGSLQFSLGGQSNQNTAGQNAKNGNAGTGSDGTAFANGNGEDGLVDLGAIAETYYVTPGGVNIRV